MFVPRSGPRYTEAQARRAVAASRSFAEALRLLGMCPTGGNNVTLRKYIHTWEISTEHFDPRAASREALARRSPRALEDILVEGSTYHRGHLKRRLFAAGLKKRECERCGQGELWRGERMSLILDHVNGVSDDHRIENLRIVCPNCAATLPTHCGRNIPRERHCLHCGDPFVPNRPEHRYCSPGCGVRDTCGGPRPELRKVERPPTQRLLDEIDELGYVEVGRRYGVSDNAIRKWIRVEGVEPPRRTWPNRRRGPAGSSGAASRSGSAPGRGRARGRARRLRPR